MGRYYIRLLRVAFTHALGPIDLWTGLVTALLGVADHFLPQTHLLAKYAWEIPIWALSAVVIVRLLLAPFWMAKADSEEIANLRIALDDKQKRQQALTRLWALRKIGVELRNEPVESANLESWLTRQNSWRQSVYEAAGDISINLRNHLETLNEVGPAPGSGTSSPYVLHIKNDLHQHFVKIISEILRRMERFLEKDL